MRRPIRRRRPGTRGARLVGFATVVQVIPGTAAPCPDTAGRRRPAAADDQSERLRVTDRAQERVPDLAAADRAAHRPRQHLPGRHLGQRRGQRRQDRPLPQRTAPLHRPPPRLRTRHRRHRALHPGHRLAPAVQPIRRLRDLGPGFYAVRIDPNARKRNPHPPARSPRLHRHPPARRLTPSPTRPRLR
jgi:hypothetical protein